MRYAHTVQAVRDAEGALMARLPEGALMQRAAAGLAVVGAEVLGRVYGARVAVLAGSGSNGGDALYAGARLARRGAAVTAVLLAPEKAHTAGLAALRAAGGRVVGADDGYAAVRRAHLVYDGIVGIGGKGGLRPQAADLMRAVYDARAAVVAVDLPSGVDADTGEVAGDAVRADVTVTFGTYKPGLLVDPAAGYAGALRLIDIGLGDDLGVPQVEALQHADVAAVLPRPSGESDKYRRGVVGVVAGSDRYPGAAVLAVSGAIRGGAGAVRYVGGGAAAVLARHPETLVSTGSPHAAGRVQAWVVGPGLGDSAAARAAVAEVLAADVPVLVDADGLRLMDRDAVLARSAPTVLTPHAGEAAALLGRPREAVEASRLDAVRALCAAYGATVLLKGSTTLVASPASEAPVRVNPTGTAWLATAGSGDILSGLAGSLLAASLLPVEAASVAAYLHGLAARLTPSPLTALDVAESLPSAWANTL
ncbi:NAD(P)H-hydrate dehydratase [Streptomyces cocklensis]|uniref:Bifunctional NAD(P)H-hydrate repair enzyme n=1 Tax=Actinacidiphila cocklensis TaxID=887465 RepID=A0A9W4GNR5_9ACTN|nr:NAD(P)H-hydrate dehydratase [Actinacidiphila cocklensis]MDD1060975.1 NAD(P)H-hydrate dehydratase [Actinacidiphila cocklensis]WSX77301.1 NAD(P)H-hydrate dehydratase [Streptomyces sp. NBC_00899]CAG6391527.1 ADP-dependent (S)-NAD(P)H-hydrate dehydratase / NAD(P)H-hydrate epimerase [Actinacidiphila cocklensis]